MNEGWERLRFQPVEEPGDGRVRVIGLGEGAGRAVNMMTAAGLPDSVFIAADSDRRSLEASRAALRVHLDGFPGENAQPSERTASGRSAEESATMATGRRAPWASFRCWARMSSALVVSMAPHRAATPVA